MPTIAVEQIRRIAQQVFEKCGTPSENAQRIAESLVESNLAGHDSHGVIQLPRYYKRVQSGRIRPEAEPVVVKQTATTLVVDGQWGFGQVAAARTMELVIEKAQLHDLGAAVIRRCNHIGRLGEYTQKAAEAGLIGFATCNSGAYALPYGGAERRFGTNPLSWAVPAGQHSPILVDFATSTVAAGKILLAIRKDEPIPLGWVVDGNGQPTTDPNQLDPGGALTLFGGYKSHGLALMADLLGGLLSGTSATALPDYDGGNGTFMFAINVAAFRPLLEFSQHTDRLVSHLKATPPAAGFDEVILPGEPERRARAERLLKGIFIDEVTWQEISALATKLEITL